MAAVMPGAVAIHSPLPASIAVYGSLFNGLVVLDDLASIEQDPYGWAPAPVDRTKAGASLAEWLALPWGGPDVVVLPGFHTASEDGLKRMRRGMPGNEVFLSVCGLMANGARTALLSRWRTGGQTSFDLVREFTQELSRSTPADAWQRAVLLTVSSPLNVEAEPRIKHSAEDEGTPKANHPFFWAGYMLVDCDTSPEQRAKKPGEPVVHEKKAELPGGGSEPPVPKKSGKNRKNTPK
jgi:hypothetical protein